MIMDGEEVSAVITKKGSLCQIKAKHMSSLAWTWRARRTISGHVCIEIALVSDGDNFDFMPMNWTME